MGLLDFKVDVVLARQEADFSDQPPSIPAVRIPAVPNHQVYLQCPTTKHPCSAQPPSIPAVPNRRVSPQCPTSNIPAVPKRRVSLECPTAKYQYSCRAFAVLQGRQLRGGREKLHFLCNNGFRVGMLEVNNFKAQARAPQLGSTFALWPGVSVVPTGQSTSIGRMHGCREKHGV